MRSKRGNGEKDMHKDDDPDHDEANIGDAQKEKGTRRREGKIRTKEFGNYFFDSDSEATQQSKRIKREKRRSQSGEGEEEAQEKDSGHDEEAETGKDRKERDDGKCKHSHQPGGEDPVAKDKSPTEKGQSEPAEERRRSRSLPRNNEPRRSRSPQKNDEKTAETGTQNTMKRFFKTADKLIAQHRQRETEQPKADFVPHHERSTKRSHSTEAAPRNTDNPERGTGHNEEGISGCNTWRKIPRMFQTRRIGAQQGTYPRGH